MENRRFSMMSPPSHLQTLRPSLPRPKMTTVISTEDSLRAFLSSFSVTPLPSTTLYLDLEGANLARDGTLSLITILCQPQNTVYLVDVATLGSRAFTTIVSLFPNSNLSLKSILEGSETLKCLWDVRNDADALFSLYGVKLANVLDIQLLENASRAGDKTFLRGLV